jgi:hypothetical protein
MPGQVNTCIQPSAPPSTFCASSPPAAFTQGCH